MSQQVAGCQNEAVTVSVQVRDFGVAGTNKAERCVEHAIDGMVNVNGKRCDHSGCDKWPSHGAEGTRTKAFRALHPEQGMIGVNVPETVM